ncbi:Mcm10 [Trypoxylus dichotomus]
MEGDLLDELINAAENLINKTDPHSASENGTIKEINLFNKEDACSYLKGNSSKIDNESVIHTGLSDSSDDEDNKYFEEAKYNEYGKTIKKLLNNSSDEPAAKTTGASWKLKAKPGAEKQLSLPETKSTTSKDVFVDPFFGIRIINPLISSVVIQERMVGRESVSMAKLKWYIQKLTPEKDWVIAGVIVQKSAAKTSQKGNQFSIWSLSDLHVNLKTASVFLFGKAHQHLWKTAVGTVVAILNANVLDKKDGSKDEACLSIDNHQKVMILGQSKDFGLCKSTKKTGEPCTSFVNTKECEFCVYHLKQEYQKFSKRSEMQSTFQGRGLTALRNKVLGKNEVFYAGKLYAAIPAKKSKKLTVKDEGRLKSLKGDVKVNSNQLTKTRNLGNRKKIANRVELSRNQRAKDLELLRKLGSSNELVIDLEKRIEFSGNLSKEVTLDESKQAALNIIGRLKANRDNIQAHSSKCAVGNNFEEIPDKSAFSTGLSKEVSKFRIETKARSEIVSIQSQSGLDSKDHPKTLSDVLGNDNDGRKLLSIEDAQRFLTETSKEIDSELDRSVEKCSKVSKMDSYGFINRDEANGCFKLPTGSKADEVVLENVMSTTGIISEQSQTDALNSLITLNKPLSFPNSSKSDHNDRKPIGNTQKLASSSKDLASNTTRSFLNLSVTPPFLSNHGKAMIDLNAPISKKSVNQAKLSALKYVQKNGQIKKSDPMSTKGTGKKRVANVTQENDPKRQKIQENEFFSERFKKMMAASSAHTDLLESRDEEEQEKYFKKLEIKEKMEEKMANTFKIECKAVRCLKCKYTSFSASERCKAEKHPLKVFDSFKRFFKCGNCGNRTVCLEVVPIIACKNCGGGKWERTSMVKEKNVSGLHNLSIRGGEQKFVNSVATDVNLDLLVPEH